MENETLSNVLQELSDKLGTTTEYLWEAFINADPDDEDRKFVWVIYWGGVFIFGLLFSINLPLTFAAFFNSEYWALKEILD